MIIGSSDDDSHDDDVNDNHNDEDDGGVDDDVAILIQMLDLLLYSCFTVDVDGGVETLIQNYLREIEELRYVRQPRIYSHYVDQ